MSLEYQRYGRNKNTLVNSTYINSGEYRNKFDKITDNKNVNRILYAKAKEMLEHRSGTMIEDMYWIDGYAGRIITCALNEQKESGVHYSDAILKAIKNHTNIITLHTHPASMPPSAADFNSAFGRGYSQCLVICHDGKVFCYASNEIIEVRLYNMYIQEFVDKGYDEFNAQIKTIEKLKMNYNISFWEVK